MALSKLEQLKINLQESKFPSYTDEELEQLLEACGGSVAKASWMGCLAKSKEEGFKKIEIGSIKLTNFDSNYFEELAEIYKQEYMQENTYSGGGKYITHMTRVDEV